MAVFDMPHQDNATDFYNDIMKDLHYLKWGNRILPENLPSYLLSTGQSLTMSEQQRLCSTTVECSDVTSIRWNLG